MGGLILLAVIISVMILTIRLNVSERRKKEEDEL